MDLNDTPEQAEYRETVRAWLEEHKAEAPVLRGEGALTDEDEIVAARRAWQGKLAEGGLAGVTWPKEFGGQGLGPIEQVIVNQEISRAGVPGILDVIGVGMLGPTIIAHGTDEQKGRYLAPMLHGDEVWCQLFSEPAAGLGPRRHPDPRAPAGRRLLGPQRPEGVDDQRAVRRLRPAARAHRRRGAQAQGPDDVHRADGRRRA